MLHLKRARLLQNKEELQGQIEATTLANKEPSLGIKEGIVEAILAQQQFPPAVSIQQYYQVSQDLTLMSNGLPAQGTS